ncbi:MAG: hypothetical protein WBB73_10940 [Candidatus Aminicenantaceae bacterium]
MKESTGTYIRTGRDEFDGLVSLIQGFLEQDRLEVVIDGKPIRGYRAPDARSIWIRDYSDMLRGLRYFEPDLKSTVEHFAETQAQNGRVFDYFTTFPEKLPCERENWTKYVRVPVEADVEFRFVKAAFLAWQATGDDDWIQKLIPSLERALEYVRSHPWRWDEENGLVKRPYTIDTWDFAYTAGAHDWLQFQIDDNTYWGIMHGDNSGYYEAFRILERLQLRFGDREAAAAWGQRARTLRDNLNRICWNGRFYTHFVKLTPVNIPGVDESQQLSLSNPMAINRGAADPNQAAAILREYQDRGQKGQAFAEWFSIDPPFPDGIFGDEKLRAGAYINGGILPLVGGELAQAAFESGFEEYGVDILRRYSALVSESGETYLWYFPDGRPSSAKASTSPEATSTDGWGSSAMLYALMEGLAGIQDRGVLFRKARIAPRWPAAGISRAEVRAEYAASGASFAYTYVLEGNSLTLELCANESEAECHILIPERRRPVAVRTDGSAVDFRTGSIGNSLYVDLVIRVKNSIRLEIDLEEGK